MKLLDAPVSTKTRRGVAEPSAIASNVIKFDVWSTLEVEKRKHVGNMLGPRSSCSTLATKPLVRPVGRPAPTGSLSFLKISVRSYHVKNEQVLESA